MPSPRPLPFQYDDITRGDYWDFRVIDDGRIQGDPYVALTDLAARIAPRGDYQYDITPYYVERRYEYPRFVCYDCHSYASYDEWDPYSTSCARFRVVIYDDPAYYPYRYNSGRNVVIPSSRRIAPKYVFKDAEPGTEYVTRLRQRDRDRPEPRDERGRTSADVGGPGTIPTPGVLAGPSREQEQNSTAGLPPLLHENPPTEGRRIRPRPAETSSAPAGRPRAPQGPAGTTRSAEPAEHWGAGAPAPKAGPGETAATAKP